MGLVASCAAEYFAGGVMPVPLGSAAAVSAPHKAFAAEDGRYVCVAVERPAQWDQLCSALGAPELAVDPRFADNASRVRQRDVLWAILARVFIAHPAEFWYERLAAAGVPVAIHWADATYAPVKQDPHVIANRLFEALETPWGVVDIVRPPWRFSTTPATLTRSPRPDEHAEEIRRLAVTEPPRAASPFAETTPAPPLAGLRVVDVSQGYAGPACSMLLGDLGAEVIKVEPPEGDYTRYLGTPAPGGESTVFLGLNRSKRSVVLDLTTNEGRERLFALVATADVFISDLLPAEAKATGVDDARLRAVNRRLITCAITPWGESGPYAGRPGGELVLQVASGVLR